ncbi:ATP-dependent dethiobiotin synthetase BioD [Sulfurovum sp. TSL6]|nr:ATP-dependent dethiobiotin synthetase BioD [Sulfurovum sp. TSL6]
MRSLFITATGTNIGKTHTTVQLIEAFAAKGLSVGVFKPIETGVSTLPHDASLLLKVCQKVNKNFKNLNPEDITAYTFPLPAAPFCADIHQEIVLEKIIKKYHELSQLCDILLVEGAGGLLVPVTKDFMMIDLAKKLKAKVLLVTPSRLGCINDTLLSMEALNSRNMGFEWCVNLFEDKESFSEVTQPFYDEVFPDWWSVEAGIQRFISTY